MNEDTLLPLNPPVVQRKKVTLAFDGGRLSSDAGVLFLREVERAHGIAERLAACVTDRSDAALTWVGTGSGDLGFPVPKSTADLVPKPD